MNKSNVPWIIGSCVLLLLVCCVGIGIAGILFQGQFRQVLALAQSNPQTTGDVPAPAQSTSVPSSPGQATLVPSTQGQATAVPTSPASSGQPVSGNLFDNALAKAKSADKYRIQFNWIFGGTQNGKYTEQPFFDFTGEVVGQNSHLVSKGGLLSMMAGNNATIEIIDADGKEYMKGITLMGMTDPQVWYLQKDTSSSSSFSSFTKPDYFSDFTGGSGANYQKTGTESLDNQSCDVYLYDMKSAQNSAFVGLLGSAQDKSSFSAIDKAAMNVWLCKDGYVHKFTLDYEGHDQNQANSKGALKMTIHVWDFNNPSITVQAPASSKPMPGN